jgi:hypothetical protein
MKYIFLSLIVISSLVACNTGDHESKEQEKVLAYSQTTDIPAGITTPNEVETSIGTLKFIDGAPYPETAELVYENLDRMRGVDAFLKGMPAASVRQLMLGPESIGADQYNKVMIMDGLLDSKPLFLTGNTSTLYVIPVLNMKETGPMVIEVPQGMLGAFNDAWFRYMGDVGPFGPDKGKGGKFLILPPDFKGEAPSGYYIVKSRTYRVWTFMRGSVANGLEAAVKNVKDNLKIYPLSLKENPLAMEFISSTGKAFNTIHNNDYSFYEHLNDVIQEEPINMIDPELRGLFASIGMEKGKPFAPDERSYW